MDNSAGATSDWGEGKCGGGLKWITVSGDGSHVFGVADNGDVMAASRPTLGNSPPFTWVAIPHNTHPMAQIMALNAEPSSPELFGVDVSGDIHYRPSLASAWVSIEQAQREKDRVHGAVCTCAHGTAADSEAQGCSTTGEHCHSCDAGWTLEPVTRAGAHRCIQCVCEHGTAATAPSACTAHGQAQCASCDAGRYLVQGGSNCHVNVCTCSHGTAAAGAACTANADHKCTSCNAGYALNAQTHLCERITNQLCVVDGQVTSTGAGAAAPANPVLVPHLPAACRPSKRLVFSVDHDEYQNRVDVFPSGEVRWMAGSRAHDATSLAGLLFTVSPLHRHILTLRPGYTSYGGEFGTVEYTLNRAAGHCQVEGVVVRDGAFGHMATLPEGCRPTRDLIFQVNNHASGARVDVDMTGKVTWVAGGAEHDWLSLTGIHFSLVTSGENMLPLANGYTHFSSEFPGSGYKRATYALGNGGALCTVQGVLVHHAKLNTGVAMATLPADCRPRRRLAFVVNQHASSCRVDAMPSARRSSVASRAWVGRRSPGDSLPLRMSSAKVSTRFL